MSNDLVSTILPLDQRQHPIQRAMGNPISSVDGLILGSVEYADIFNLSQAAQNIRTFIGMSIYNPSSVATINVAMGPEFHVGKNFAVPPTQFITFDYLTYGAQLADETTKLKTTRIRAALDANQGTLSSATIDYSGSGQPTDQQTVQIGSLVYEFSNDASKSPLNNVLVAIGATADDSWTNFRQAVEDNEQGVIPTIDTGLDIVTITNKYGGTYGDGFVVADGASPTGAVFSGNTAGGAGGITGVLFTIW
jgi:hypothetical protein